MRKSKPLFASVALTLLVVVSAVAYFAPALRSNREARPGEFDSYMLALSWAPTFCELLPDSAHKEPLQCGEHRQFGFVIHGLWPKDGGIYLENCQVNAPAVPESLVTSMLDIMPSPWLIQHEWSKHGACTGLPVQDYFALVRKVYGLVHIPEQFDNGHVVGAISPAEVKRSFMQANPGLTPREIKIDCRKERLEQVRICFDRHLGLTDCAVETVIPRCTSESLSVPTPQQ